ncbi:hypothetical protein Mgra_00001516 [Meloidogyne graminicola]|uniref:Uncharacterized protein n=1 Tax=Meloidogyne graminicola TaxID=189291 RepID=A0A8T0A0C3_9BILA|nr:hypothetical protein Mgra_00001516 [Meloidogyne graminicola]
MNLQNKINSLRHFSFMSKVKDYTMKLNQLGSDKCAKTDAVTCIETALDKEQKEKLEIGYPLLTSEWESLLKKWADERDQFREKLEQTKPIMIEPTELQRQIVVWSGMYSELSSVPDKLNSYQVKQHAKSLLRRAIFLVLFIYCSLFYIYRCDDTESTT